MKFVEFYSLEKTGKQEVIGTVVFENEKVTFLELSKEFIEYLKLGIRLPKLKGEVYPKDGLKFLEVLPLTFTGTYLRASEVMEG